MEIEGLSFFVVDENPKGFNLSPKALGGTTVRLSLIADDPTPWLSAPLPPARPRSSPSRTSRTACAKAAWKTRTATTG
jgi:hypothetical protein